MAEQQKPKFACDSCGKKYTWKPDLAGRKAKCACGNVMTVPKAVGGGARTAPAGAKPAMAGAATAARPKPKPAPPPAAAAEEDDFDAAFDGIGDDDFAEAAAPAAAPPPYKPAGTTAKPTAAATPASAGAASSKPGVLESVASFVPDNDNWKWWYYIIGGALMLPVAFYQYFRLLDYENNEDTLRLKSFERMLYGIFGKWGVCGFIVLIGAFCIVIGLAKWEKEKREAAAGGAA